MVAGRETSLIFVGREPGHGLRAYVQDLIGGPARAITPEGASSYYKLSLDGKRLAIAMGAYYRTIIFPVDSGEPQSVPGLQPGEVPITWSRDGRFLYCARLGEVPLNIFQVD